MRFLPSIFAEKNEYIWVPKTLPTIWHTYTILEEDHPSIMMSFLTYIM
jgi:hypothetical protein